MLTTLKSLTFVDVVRKKQIENEKTTNILLQQIHQII